MAKTDEYGRYCGYVPQEVLDKSSNNAGSNAEDPPEGKNENLITSRLHIGVEVEKDKWYHRPVIDIDFPARLVPSSTDGHFHLYLDGVLVPHDKYMYLLAALASCGIISDGYQRYSTDRGYTAVRMPGNFKPKAPEIDYTPKHMKPKVPDMEDIKYKEAAEAHNHMISKGVPCSDALCRFCDNF